MVLDINLVDTLISHGYITESVSDTSETLRLHVRVHEDSKPITVEYYPKTGHIVAEYYYRLSDTTEGRTHYYNLDLQKLLHRLALLARWIPIASTMDKALIYKVTVVGEDDFNIALPWR